MTRHKISLVLSVLALASCSRPEASSPQPARSTTPTATATQAFPTLFPTSTRTPAPTEGSTPSVLGEILFRDEFQTDLGWDLEGIASGGMSLIEGRLALSTTVRGGALYAIAPQENPTDFYAQVEIRNEICEGLDAFGIAFRYRSPSEHYRFTLTCNGKARFTRLTSGTALALVPLTDTPAAIRGAPALNRMAVVATGSEFQFFINGLEVFRGRDASLPSGRIALLIWARDGQQATVSFNDFTLQALLPTSTPRP